MTDAANTENKAPIFDGTLFLSPNIDYFQNGDDFFVYHNLYGYILKMSEDLVDFLEFFHDGPKDAEAVTAQFGEVFDADTLNNFLSVFRPLSCLLPSRAGSPSTRQTQKPSSSMPSTPSHKIRL